MRVDVGPAWRSLLELLTDLADEDVDRAVAVGHAVAPDLLVDLLAREDLAHRACQQAEHLELAAREVQTLLACVDLEARKVDLELARYRRRGHQPGSRA